MKEKQEMTIEEILPVCIPEIDSDYQITDKIV